MCYVCQIDRNESASSQADHPVSAAVLCWVGFPGGSRQGGSLGGAGTEDCKPHVRGHSSAPTPAPFCSPCPAAHCHHNLPASSQEKASDPFPYVLPAPVMEILPGAPHCRGVLDHISAEKKKLLADISELAKVSAVCSLLCLPPPLPPSPPFPFPNAWLAPPMSRPCCHFMFCVGGFAARRVSI